MKTTAKKGRGARLGNSYSLQIVRASDAIRDATGEPAKFLAWGLAAVELQRGLVQGESYVSLVLESTPALTMENSTAVSIEVRHPDAIRALANALLTLLADPTTAEMLACIQPTERP